MNETLARLDSFIARWRGSLGERAEVIFETRALDGRPATSAALADDLVGSLGYKPIGANWEMLDPGDDEGAPRSAIAAFADALAMDMALPQEEWLGDLRARQCGREFLACFAPAQRTILTNRMYFGWNPVSTAAIEWAFAAHDDSAIALMLLTREG